MHIQIYNSNTHTKFKYLHLRTLKIKFATLGWFEITFHHGDESEELCISTCNRLREASDSSCQAYLTLWPWNKSDHESSGSTSQVRPQNCSNNLKIVNLMSLLVYSSHEHIKIRFMISNGFWNRRCYGDRKCPRPEAVQTSSYSYWQVPIDFRSLRTWNLVYLLYNFHSSNLNRGSYTWLCECNSGLVNFTLGSSVSIVVWIFPYRNDLEERVLHLGLQVQWYVISIEKWIDKAMPDSQSCQNFLPV